MPKRFKLKVLTSLVFGILVGMVCAGCKNEKVAATTPVVSITLDWRPEPEFGGFYQAQLADTFKNRGLNVQLQNGGAGAPTWQLVAQGKTDFATTSADLVLLARSRGADVVALFAVYQTSPLGIMVHQARGFKNLEDVFSNKGNLGVENNPWLKFLLNKYPSPAVTITGDPQGVGLFLAQKDYSQQCFITSEPILARHQGGDPQTFLVADSGFNPYVTVLITNGKTLKEKPELAGKVVAACREGWRAYLNDPSAANASMENLNREMDPRTFLEAADAQKPLIETDETKQNGLGSMTTQRWNTLAQQLTDLKVIDKAPPAEECFVNLK